MTNQLTHVLSQIRGGRALDDAGKKMAEVVKAVKDTGKPGEITFTIKISPDKTDETVVKLHPSLKFKIPERPYAEGIFYVNEKTGELSREDPRQHELKLEREAELKEQGAIAMSRVGRGTTE